MNRHESEPQLLRSADYRAQGRDHNEIARQLKRGDIVKIAPGVYAPTSLWTSSFPETRHTLRVHAQHKRLRTPVFALYSAAAVHTVDLLGPWPDRVHIVEPRAPHRGSRSAGQAVRHQAPLSDADVTVIDGISVTNVARTAYDLACELPFIEAVAMLDSVRCRRRSLASLEELTEEFEAGRRLPGRPRALKALSFSTDLADSVQESRSRMLLYALGFPEPELQHELTCDGTTYRADFWWEEYGHWGEFDGKGKYLSPKFQNGRSADQVVVDEKRREDAIRRNVSAFSRWDIHDLNDPQRLRAILVNAGLPCGEPRVLPA